MGCITFVNITSNVTKKNDILKLYGYYLHNRLSKIEIATFQAIINSSVI